MYLFRKNLGSDEVDFKEDGFMLTLALVVVAFVIVQAIFFLVRAIKRARQLGIEKSTIKSTIVSSGLFTVAPAIGIVATVLTLAAGLGYVLPWIRLTVIGNISYEVTAATNAIEAYGLSGGIANAITDKEVFGTVAWVMTLGSIMPLLLIPFLLKTVQKKIGKTVSKNGKWSSVMSAAAFIGLIAAFVARAIAGKGGGRHNRRRRRRFIGCGADFLGSAYADNSKNRKRKKSKMARLVCNAVFNDRRNGTRYASCTASA